MTNALFKMEDAPRDGTWIIGYVAGAGNPGPHPMFWCKEAGQWVDKPKPDDPDAVWPEGWPDDGRVTGFLPLPSDASSGAVAGTTVDWRSVCEEADVEAAILKDGGRLSAGAKARIIREWLAGDGVREATARPLADYSVEGGVSIATTDLMTVRDMANARLIASAPDLLAALEECASDLEAEIEARYPAETRKYPSEKRRYQRDMEPVRAARAAIDKARGK